MKTPVPLISNPQSRFSNFHRRLCLLLIGICAGVQAADDAWPVPGARVRFQVHLDGPPTHPSAGYFLHIPDGGILPAPKPGLRVLDAQGKELQSGVLWQSRDAGVCLVFAAPAQGEDVTIYVESAPSLKLWNPASGLTPSALLCTQPDAAGLRDAQELAQLGAVGPTAFFLNRAGEGRAPLSVPGDLSGRSGPCALYLQTYVALAQPGETWFAPIVFDGQVEVRVDGQALRLRKASGKPGGTGESLTLKSGLHRVEILCWAPRSNTKNGLMTLTWRTPDTQPREMGGIRPSDLPHAGTPMWDSRPLRGNEIVRSGRASIQSAERADGGPLARMALAPLENYWLENETPLLLYQLSALPAGNPKGTRYVWSLGQGGRPAKPEVFWLFPGGRDQTAELTAIAGDQRSTCRVLFHPFTAGRTDLNQLAARQAFQRAALDIFEAYPPEQDPTADWTASHWNNFFRTLELGKGQRLLSCIFSSRWDQVSRKISPDHQRLLKDIFLDYESRNDPNAALAWAERLEKSSVGPLNAGLMRLLRADIHLYYLDAPDKARALVEGVIAARQSDELLERARIRLGDIEFLSRRLNEATALYADVQNRAAKGRMRLAPPTAATAAAPASTDFGASVKAASEAQRQQIRNAAATPSSERIADWKVNALLDTASSETVKALLAQDYLLEARQALQQWERGFPLSKVSGDYLLNEARFHIALGDWKRANALLSAYCDNIDASSYLPEAVLAALDCKRKLEEPAEKVVAFCRAMKKKLEFHPAVERINDTLQKYGAKPE